MDEANNAVIGGGSTTMHSKIGLELDVCEGSDSGLGDREDSDISGDRGRRIIMRLGMASKSLGVAKRCSLI